MKSLQTVVVVLALGLVACGGDPPQIPPETAAPAAADVAPTDEAATAVTTPEHPPGDEPQEPEAWQKLAQQLEAEVGRLETELAATKAQVEVERAETERYRAGLDRAVAELNRVVGDAAASAVREQMPPPRQRVYALGLPFVQPMLEGWGVSGRVWNEGPRDISGTLVVELLRSGSVIDTHTEPIRAASGVETPYTVVFRRPTDQEGNYNARVRVDY